MSEKKKFSTTGQVVSEILAEKMDFIKKGGDITQAVKELYICASAYEKFTGKHIHVNGTKAFLMQNGIYNFDGTKIASNETSGIVEKIHKVVKSYIFDINTLDEKDKELFAQYLERYKIAEQKQEEAEMLETNRATRPEETPVSPIPEQSVAAILKQNVDTVEEIDTQAINLIKKYPDNGIPYNQAREIVRIEIELERQIKEFKELVPENTLSWAQIKEIYEKGMPLDADIKEKKASLDTFYKGLM